MRTIFAFLLEGIANRLDIPVGAVLCIYLAIAGLLSISEIAIATETDLYIGASMWGLAFVLCWLAYGNKFWAKPSSYNL